MASVTDNPLVRHMQMLRNEHRPAGHRRMPSVRRPALSLGLALTLLVTLQHGGLAVQGVAPHSHDHLLDQSGWTLLASDDFSDPSQSIMDDEPHDPAHIQIGDVGGEYQIASLDPDTFSFEVPLRGRYDDAMISVDARLIGATNDRDVAVICRLQPDSAHYRFEVLPDLGEWVLVRVDVTTETRLAPPTRSASIQRGNQSNHLDLQCVGSTISAYINGTHVVSVQDGTYHAGQWSLVAGHLGDTHLQYDARFANLAVYRPASAPAVPPLFAPPAPAAPSNLQATALDSTLIRLDWTNNATGAQGLQVEVALTAAVIATLPPDATSYTLVGLTPGTEYCLVVRVFGEGGASESTQACATTPP